MQRSLSTVNPPETITRSPSLTNNLVRLEVPVELDDGDWDGPIYDQLVRPLRIPAVDDSPFMTDQSIQRRYEGKIQRISYMRLTEPAGDFSRERDERPLLTLYRMAAIGRVFPPDCFVRVQSPTVVCGQVTSYFRRESRVLVDNGNVNIDPGCEYWCTVDLRSSRTICATATEQQRG